MSVADSASAAMLRVLEAIASEMDEEPSAEMASAAIKVYEAIIESSIALGDGSDGEEPGDIRSMPIEALGLDRRCENILSKIGCKTVDDVTELSPVDILSVKQSGQAALRAIEDTLESRGLRLSEYGLMFGGAR